MITAKFLKDIMAEARPIIERQMNDAKLIAGFRDVVASNGGDWGALKALIKAHVEDENDETGEGKRVQKIRDKADSTSAYADMLGLANMNENNFSHEQFDAATGEIISHSSADLPGVTDSPAHYSSHASGTHSRSDQPQGPAVANECAGTSSDENPAPYSHSQPLPLSADKAGEVFPHPASPVTPIKSEDA